MKILVLLLLATSTMAIEPGSFEEKASSFSWKCLEEIKLPNVLILGDSISIGYTLQVRQYLKGKANVHRPLTPDGGPENCGHSSNTLNNLEKWLGDKKWDLIHFNTGLHDLKRIATEGKSTPTTPTNHTLESYEQNLNKIVAILKTKTKHIIFATTTPYPDGVQPLRLPEDAGKYNAVALKVMKHHGVVINDLYGEVVNRLEELQSPKNVHFKEAGSAVLGKKVATTIAEELKLGKLIVPKYNTATEAQKAAKVLLDENKVDEAEQALLFAAALAPNKISKARSVSTLATVYVDAEKWDKACQLLKQAKLLTHDHPFGVVVKISLLKCLIKLGNKNAANTLIAELKEIKLRPSQQKNFEMMLSALAKM